MGGVRCDYPLDARYFRIIRHKHLSRMHMMCACFLSICGEARQSKNQQHAGKQSRALNITGHGIRRSFSKRSQISCRRKGRRGLTVSLTESSNHHGVYLLSANGARSRHRLAGEAAFRACMDAATVHWVVYLWSRCCYFEVSLNTAKLTVFTKTHQQHFKELLSALYSISFHVLYLFVPS